MKKILVCGNFGKDESISDGQTIKTVTIYKTLTDLYGNRSVIMHNTAGGIISLISLLIKMPRYLFACEDIIVLPAHNGVRLIIPLFVFFTIALKRRVHYVVIGGWLPFFLKEKKFLRRTLKSLRGIYVETKEMHDMLLDMGFNNLYILPNYKILPVLKPCDLRINFDEDTYPLCTFSRVSKEKGIEDAINAVKTLNKKCSRTTYTLDIYGVVFDDDKLWFEKLSKSFPDYVRYMGGIPYNKSTEVLKNYFAMLFPTYYNGEGLAGSIIDAFSAGLPVVASNWRYNPSLIKDKKTGLLFTTHNVSEMVDGIEYLSGNLDVYKKMRLAALEESMNYKPGEIIKVLINNFCD